MGITAFILFESWGHQIKCLPSLLPLQFKAMVDIKKDSSWMEMPRESRLKLQDLELGYFPEVTYVYKTIQFSGKADLID